jgi:ATP adenylyltransferase
MTAYRSRAEHLRYQQYLKGVDPSTCVFCAIKKGDDQLVEETANFKVIHNIFPYSLWDGQSVEDHLMITPKKHTDSLSSMTLKQKGEYVDLVERYEREGYNIYARAPISKIKTIPHQHTHLIKSVGGASRFLLLIRRPYLRIVR